MPVRSLDSIRSSKVNLCSVFNLLIPEGWGTCADVSSYDSIFSLKSKHTISYLFWLAKITHEHFHKSKFTRRSLQARGFSRSSCSDSRKKGANQWSDYSDWIKQYLACTQYWTTFATYFGIIQIHGGQFLRIVSFVLIRGDVISLIRRFSVSFRKLSLSKFVLWRM